MSYRPQQGGGRMRHGLAENRQGQSADGALTGVGRVQRPGDGFQHEISQDEKMQESEGSQRRICCDSTVEAVSDETTISSREKTAGRGGRDE
jgi:hypothetical protein